MMIEILLILILGVMMMHIMASSPTFAPRGGLVYQSEVVSNLALSTLTGNTAIFLSQSFNAITATFLMKHADVQLYLEGITADEGPFMIGICNGNATITEVTTAMNEANTIGPDDVTQQLTQDNAWVVYQKGVRNMIPLSGGTQWYLSASFSLGKGIPWAEGSGWNWFLYNADPSTLTTGGVCKGRIRTQGVWLGA